MQKFMNCFIKILQKTCRFQKFLVILRPVWHLKDANLTLLLTTKTDSRMLKKCERSQP